MSTCPLVAVSTGLLQSMNKEEVEGVLGHEIAHVANGDMVTLALIQGVVNTFVIVLARVVGSIVDRAVFRSERGNGPGYFITVLVLVPVAASLVGVVGVSGFMYTPQLAATLVVCAVVAAVTIPAAAQPAGGDAGLVAWLQSYDRAFVSKDLERLSAAQNGILHYRTALSRSERR